MVNCNNISSYTCKLITNYNQTIKQEEYYKKNNLIIVFVRPGKYFYKEILKTDYEKNKDKYNIYQRSSFNKIDFLVLINKPIVSN